MKFVFVSWGNLHRSPRSPFLIKSLIKSGHQVKIIFIVSTENRKDEFMRSELIDQVDVLFLERNVNEKKGREFFRLSYLMRRFKKKITHILKKIIPSSVRTILYWRRCKLIAASIARNPRIDDFIGKPDVIYACEFHHSSETAFQLSKKYNCAFIYDLKEHYESQSHYDWLTVKYIRAREREYFSKSLFLPTVSQGFLDLYSRVHPKHKHKFVLLENTLPKGLGKKYIQNTLEKKCIKVIISMGGLTKDRGLREFLMIWDCLDQDVNAHLYVRIGVLSEEDRHALIALAKNSYQKSWSFVSPVNNEAILNSNDDFDIGVIPYLPNKNNHIYCSPGKFSQYLASGLAVISTNTLNIGKKVSLQQIGLVYDAGDIEKSAVLLGDFINNYQLVCQSKQNAIRYYESEFFWEKQAEPYIRKIEAEIVG